MKQTLRIIGGRFRGKKITFTAIDGLRPTSDRVRETLFNWLMQSIHNARCLDAFAGSGALGLEAFSRGAAEVCFIEQNRTAAQHLQNVMTSFNSPKLSVINTDAMAFIRDTPRQFDLIFLDPPFAGKLLLPCLHQLSASNILAPDGLVYFESPERITPDPDQWQIIKEKKAGQVIYGLLQKQS